MKKTNFTNPKLVKNWLLVVALIFTSYSATMFAQGNSCQLNVEDEVSISVDENCEAKLTKKMFLTDDGKTCKDGQSSNGGYYKFEVRSADGSEVIYPMNRTVVLSQPEIEFGVLYMVILEAYDVDDNLLNTGMSTFYVYDKMPPTIDCPTDTMEIACWQSDGTLVSFQDNCSTAHLVWIDESITENDCSTGPGGLNWPYRRFKQIKRSYVAVDASGNKSAPCDVVLNVNSFDYWNGKTVTPDSNAYFNPNVPNLQGDNAISCKDADNYKDADGNFDPNKTGWPELIYWDENPSLAEQAAYDIWDTIEISNNCQFNCNLAATYIDVKVNTCPECIEKVIRTWTVLESNCDPNNFNSAVFFDIQLIEVVDTIPPVIICPENKTITTNTVDDDFPPGSAGQVNCGAWFTFPVPQMSDECSNNLSWTISVKNDMGTPIAFADSIETKTPVHRKLPFGVDTITYTVYDRCGNSSSCDWTVTVKDNTPPVAICQQNTTVSLTYDGEAEIPAIDFNSGSYDDCLIDRFKVRRMDNKVDCEGHTDLLWHDYATFCCDDIANNDITVIMRVWDKQGNWNDCMVQVNVQDKLPPEIVCPPSLCVQCDYPFELDNLGDYFGNIVQGYENIETHTIYGDYGSEYVQVQTNQWDCLTPVPNFSFNDGWAHDNCGLEITSSYVDNRDQCNSGNIVRTFVAEDPNGSRTCTQTIHFYNPDPFDENDITWPAPYTVEGCFNEAAYGPDITGRPILDEDACDLVASNYKDDVFHFNDDQFDAEGVCFKVIRHWTVMDWCQRDAFGQFKTWTWDQVIMVSETTPPEFTSICEEKETCTYDTECEDGYIELTMSAHDECTTDPNLRWRYRIYDYNATTGSFDILIKDSRNFANPIISGPNASASGTYALGKHRIVWTVWDQCGNTATCDTYFTIKNCKKPTPRCIDHISVEMMPVDTDNDGVADWAMINVDANLVESCCAKSSHPCGYPLKYSFSADTTDVQRTYDCDDEGLQEVQMWVTALLPDGTVTQDYCVTHIDFQDNNNVCPDVPAGTINVSGKITTINDEPIAGTEIDVQGSELTPQTTSDDGTFAFSVDADRNYIVTPSKDGDDLNGISTLDLVLIQKHILGLKAIDNPYLLLAANVNHDTKVSASDILQLRKLILGSTDDIGESWLFIDKNYEFENSNKPYMEHIPNEISINSENDLNLEFYGIKMGDINNSLELRSAEKLELVIDAINVSEGEIEVPVYANNFNDISGFQYSINFNKSVLSFEKIESGELKVNNANIGLSNLDKGIVTMSWNTSNAESVSPDQVLFTLKFKASADAKLQDVLSLSSDITRKEAYDADLEVMNVELKYRNAETDEFELYQNIPNPFSVYTDISFNLPESSEGSLSIYDLTGKTLKVINSKFDKGVNTIRIKKSDINVSGVLYYRLETGSYTATKKMILIK